MVDLNNTYFFNNNLSLLEIVLKLLLQALSFQMVLKVKKTFLKNGRTTKSNNDKAALATPNSL